MQRKFKRCFSNMKGWGDPRKKQKVRIIALLLA